MESFKIWSEQDSTFLTVYLAAEADDVIAGASIALNNAKARIRELEAQLLARGGHNSDCPVSWKGECYCGWEEMKKSLMGG